MIAMIDRAQAYMEYSFEHPQIRLLALILHFLLMLHSVNTLNNHKLVYTQCPNQTQAFNPSYPALLSVLFQELITRSSRSRFFQTIVADDDNNIAISGMYQCRNDLSTNECENCVRRFPALSESTCGENIPSRIQLSGCYFHHQEENADAITDSGPGEILHRACDEREIKESIFDRMKYAAFEALENGVVNGNGFCDTTYEGIHVVGQCSGFLRACDCGECVNSAAQIAGGGACRFSVSGDVYLDGCFISYHYDGYRNFRGYLGKGNGRGGNSSKLVAIFVGGLALLSLGVGLCCFMRSCGKKNEDW